MTARFATLTRQCWLFAIGSSFFAAATVPGFPALAGAGVTNTLCFVGSWFFTTAAGIQLVLAGRGLDWWSALTQFAGTLLFNLSTGVSVWAHAVLAVLAVGTWSPKSVGWQAAWINMMGCVAFGVSALAAFVRKTGVTVDERLANFGTFVGALCFLAAALMLRPRPSTAPTLH